MNSGSGTSGLGSEFKIPEIPETGSKSELQEHVIACYSHVSGAELLKLGGRDL